MTYCVAISTDHGLVFCSDSRTTAGPDMLSLYSKMRIFQPGPQKVLCILSAGNLATTQSVISRIELDIELSRSKSLLTCERMDEVIRYVAQISHEEHNDAQLRVQGSGVDVNASFIVGGQFGSGKPHIYFIYSAGNFISDSEETPYLQTGETKYGKPILDRILTRSSSLNVATKCALVSMDATIKSNATVSPPVDLFVYSKDSFSVGQHVRLHAEDDYLEAIRIAWDKILRDGFYSLPDYNWISK